MHNSWFIWDKIITLFVFLVGGSLFYNGVGDIVEVSFKDMPPVYRLRKLIAGIFQILILVLLVYLYSLFETFYFKI